QSFDSHRVAADFPTGEEVAGTIPLAVIVGHRMVTVLAAECDGKRFETDPFRFLGVLLGLLHLANQARLHSICPLCISLDTLHRSFAEMPAGLPYVPSSKRDPSTSITH
ncbi:MAG: hypothetical protein KGR25_03310, partial [Chloroflexi bacterium]|nr:hypothetical protein [Chloroflexota bacterium]